VTQPTSTSADPEQILARLNPEQRAAAQAVRGPVAILAGAGTGKTTAITHRIAYQVATGTFRANQILAVTFTDKAAGELVERLDHLGVGGVQARTFHAAALSQLGRAYRQATGNELPQILGSKGPILNSLVNRLPAPHKFRPRREFATEIEWAKNRRIRPERYVEAVARSGHEPPIPPEMAAQIYAAYEERRARTKQMDFEDMLELALWMFDTYPATIEQIRERISAVTVDEFQDVNLLQHELLLRWLGDRDDLCVVGDDYQTIYSFTGASPRYLIGFGEWFPGAQMIKLVRNYRSTPQILTVANRVAAGMRSGIEKQLVPSVADGDSVSFAGFPEHASEVDAIVARIRAAHAAGTAQEEIAILVRINARTEPLEEALAAAGIPYQVRDGDFLRRDAARGVLAALRRGEPGADAVEAIDEATAGLGYDPDVETDSEEEETRQADLARLRALAREFAGAHEPARLDAFVEDLRARFQGGQHARGVHLLTYHRSKGLEWDVVFLPRMIDGELPYRHRGAVADVDEERRLLYVGVTRARKHLHISWTGREITPYLREFIAAPAQHLVRNVTTVTTTSAADDDAADDPRRDDPMFQSLREWRLGVARNLSLPAYTILHDATLLAIAEQRPQTMRELSRVKGVGPSKLDRYGEEILKVLRAG